MARVFLGLGSNLGDRRKNILSALESIGRLQDTSIVKCSSIYETEPWGVKNQPKFLNCVCEIDTGLGTDELLARLISIEQRLGRRRTGDKLGPRVIDLDILIYADLIENREGLCIPHPGMHERRFVLVPFCEIAPELMHPELKKTVRELLDNCPDDLSVEYHSDPPKISA